MTAPPRRPDKYIFNGPVSLLLGASLTLAATDDAGASDLFLQGSCHRVKFTPPPLLSFLRVPELLALPASCVFWMASEVGCLSDNWGCSDSLTDKQAPHTPVPNLEAMTLSFRMVFKGRRGFSWVLLLRTPGPRTSPCKTVMHHSLQSQEPTVCCPGQLVSVTLSTCRATSLGRDGGSTQGPQSHFSIPTPAHALLPFMPVW